MRSGGGTWWEEAAEIRTSRGGRLAAGGIFRGKFRRSDESRGAGPQDSAPEGPPREEATRQVGPSAGKVPWRERRCGAEVHLGKLALLLGAAFLTFPILGFDVKSLSGLLFFFQASDTDAVARIWKSPIRKAQTSPVSGMASKNVGQDRQKPP